jgi:DNA-directed RNA polymerase specialized sigma24 family protein
MSSVGSVSDWIRQLKRGDRAGVQHLWEGYFRELVALARKKLGTAPRQAADEEDVALSAFDSFCRGAENGRFPQLMDRDSLWHLLIVITARKAANLAKKEAALKRGGRRIQNAPAGSAEGDALAELIAREPDPLMAAQVAEQTRLLLDLLGDDRLRSIAVWKMEAHTNEEIAARLACSVGTVERKLRLIRTIWSKEMVP